MENFKKAQKNSEITEDDLKGIEKDIQKLTDNFTKDIDNVDLMSYNMYVDMCRITSKGV